MIVKQLTEHHMEFLSLKVGCRGSSESTHALAHIYFFRYGKDILYYSHQGLAQDFSLTDKSFHLIVTNSQRIQHKNQNHADVSSGVAGLNFGHLLSVHCMQAFVAWQCDNG